MSSPTGPIEGAHLRRSQPPLSPERVRTHEFPRPPLGRRGYDVDEVQRFLARIAEDLAASDAEKAKLRAEIDRLKNYFRERGVDVTSPGGNQGGSWPNVAAVNLLSRAQQAADAQVAQAEDYCRSLVAEATRQYEEILRNASEQARAAAAQAGALERSDIEVDVREQAALEQRIAWLRTFAEVTQVQLRSTLEALAGEVDKLGDLPSPEPSGTDPSTGTAADAPPTTTHEALRPS